MTMFIERNPGSEEPKEQLYVHSRSAAELGGPSGRIGLRQPLLLSGKSGEDNNGNPVSFLPGQVSSHDVSKVERSVCKTFAL